MKKLFYLFLLLTISSCTNKAKDYATLSGTIKNPHESMTLKIYDNSGYEKIIEINADGSFRDTLKIKASDYNFQHGDQYGSLYLQNGNNTSFTTDYYDFDNSLMFAGDASDVNNFSIKSFLIPNQYITNSLFENGTDEDLSLAIKNYMDGYETLKSKYPQLDSVQLKRFDDILESNIVAIKGYFVAKQSLRKAFPKGSASPTFENYENYNGGTSSLSDFKGKYVYIDIWATWCAPCLAEVPSLKAIEEEYKSSNIVFLSISIDDGRGYKANNDDLMLMAAKEGWKKMIVSKALGGTQLFADQGWESQFIRDYNIDAIPRFLLLDPNGLIVTADAPRPSDPELKNLLTSLGL